MGLFLIECPVCKKPFQWHSSQNQICHECRPKRLLRKSHKNLRIEEASYIYCKRNNLMMDFEEFIDDVYMKEDFKDSDVIDQLCKDIRHININSTMEIKSLTINEWEDLVNEFGNE